jgi:hypothetical protein
MTRKPIITADAAAHQVFVTPATIQYLRTGRRRPTARKVGAVAGVHPVFA